MSEEFDRADDATQDVSTEAQRRALDAMSAELVQKLNCMIEEQEARVQTFATQLPADFPEQPVRTAQCSTAAQAAPAMPRQVAPVPQSVTPPPIRPQQSPRTAPRRETVPPPMPPRPKPQAEEEKGSSFSGGKVFILLVVVFILIRSCS